MADERCVYANVVLDASSLCEQIFVKLLTILKETFDRRDFNLPAKLIVGGLFTWVAVNGELHVQHCFDLRVDIANVIEDRACEHGSRYKALVEINAFWDEKRLRTLKDARRVTQHHHFPFECCAPLIDEVKTVLKKEVKEWRE